MAKIQGCNSRDVAVEVQSDFEGYFEALVRRAIGRASVVAPIPLEKVVVSAGPYRSSAVTYSQDGGTMSVDFYSAIRTGFGTPVAAVEDHLVGVFNKLAVEAANRGYSSLPGAAEDERTSMAARRTTCVCCNHGDHEVSLGKGESCDCPCHGGYGAEYQSKDRLRR